MSFGLADKTARTTGLIFCQFVFADVSFNGETSKGSWKSPKTFRINVPFDKRNLTTFFNFQAFVSQTSWH